MDSLYLVGFKDKLVVFDLQTESEIYEIIKDQVFLIKRVVNSNAFILRADKRGVNLLTIDGKESFYFSW
jgi:hypothetical protein